MVSQSLVFFAPLCSVLLGDFWKLDRTLVGSGLFLLLLAVRAVLGTLRGALVATILTPILALCYTGTTLYWSPCIFFRACKGLLHVFADLASPAPAGACCAGAIIGAHFPVDLFLDRLCYFDLWRRDWGMQKPASWRFNRCWALLWSASISAKDYDGLVARLAQKLHACYLVFHLASIV